MTRGLTARVSPWKTVDYCPLGAVLGLTGLLGMAHFQTV
jgi:hypothetical protein